MPRWTSSQFDSSVMLTAAPASGPKGNIDSIWAPAMKIGMGAPGTFEVVKSTPLSIGAEHRGGERGRQAVEDARHRLEQVERRLAALAGDEFSHGRASRSTGSSMVHGDGEPGRGELVAGDVCGVLGAHVDRHVHAQRARPRCRATRGTGESTGDAGDEGVVERPSALLGRGLELGERDGAGSRSAPTAIRPVISGLSGSVAGASMRPIEATVSPTPRTTCRSDRLARRRRRAAEGGAERGGRCRGCGGRCGRARPAVRSAGVSTCDLGQRRRHRARRRRPGRARGRAAAWRSACRRRRR